MLPSLYGEKADLLVRLEDKLRNEDKGSVEMSFVHLARFFGNASKKELKSDPSENEKELSDKVKNDLRTNVSKKKC